MQCSVHACSGGGHYRCKECGELYCSKAHQHQDWYSGRHQANCRIRKIQASMQDVQGLYKFGDKKRVPAWFTNHFDLDYIANGTYGIVWRAITKGPGQRRIFALKMMFDAQLMLENEARIAMLLSKLYVDNGDAYDTLTPILTTYDYGQSMWTKQGVSAFLDQDRTNPVQVRNLQKLENRLTDYQPVGFMLMELAPGVALRRFLAQNSQPEIYLSLLPDLLLQVLLMLNDMQKLVKFMHYDLHAGNLLVQEMADPVVLSYAMASDTTFKIKTKYVVRLFDFGSSRMEWQGTVYDANPVYIDGKPTSEFHPWFDLVVLAMDLCGMMNSEQFMALQNYPRVVELLVGMTTLQSTAAEAAALNTATQMLRDLNQPGAKKTPDDAARFASVALTALEKVFNLDPTTVKEPVPTPEQIVRDSVSLFWKHQQYSITKDDVAYDMSMQVGHQSGSARVGVTAPKVSTNAGLFEWLGTLVK